MSIDLTFSDLSARAVQYNARASVEDFDACMAEYAALAQRARAQTPGIYDLRYGMSAAERLDLFPASAQPAPLLIFIHGGYWHSQRKEEACSMAAAFARRGVAVATLEYTLAPEATLAEIVHEVRSAVAWLYHHGAPFGIDPARIFVSGSSAGGHLCGMLIADGWQQRYRLPPDAIKGALALSGLYDLRPLCDIYINDWLHLTPEQAQALSPLFLLPAKEHAPQILLDVGQRETQGFKNQTQAYYDACLARGLDVQLLADRHCNHFTLVNELADAESAMFRQVIAMIDATAQS
ncbi:alpha/beta hydrolase [Serratia marcescens]|uniref:alpha/beta hydrolase fold domain-containing protein n=1 Tax=Serratia marcescens TaxID=615 RepID=UPI0018DA0D2A|nr:alpha/beta hydrolase [Serratia marcescens]MBN5285938.1 alpha/beta hydrolase [Serratia marcescens]HEJ6993562.1 alpha/beta hydrolase [Serratia marcescens]